jgi:sugar/nucleoside kinase (ribokinase family)
MSIDIRRLIEVISDEPTRRALEELARESIDTDGVREVISQTTFGFQESSGGDDDEREVRLEPIIGDNLRRPERPEPPPPRRRLRHNI